MQTMLADMDSWKRVAGEADADGAFTPYTKDVAMLLALGQILTALNGIRARLDAGIKTQSGTIAINI